MQIRVLSARDVRSAVDMTAAIEAMRAAFGQLSRGTARVPPRLHLEVQGGVTLLMPASLGETGALGAKLVSVFQGNRVRGLAPVQGIVVLLDDRTGTPRAVLEGASLTALRTGAASGLATELLAPRAASVAAVFGAGLQARTQIEAVRQVRALREIRILSRTRAAAERLRDELDAPGIGGPPSGRPGSAHLTVRVCEDPAEALRGAEIVIAATSSREPVFRGANLEAGAHVCAIGAYTPEMREIDSATVSRARVVVDTREGALREAGDLLHPIREGVLDPGRIVELGEIVNGDEPPGAAGWDVTLFKSVGTAAQDLELARRAVDRAEALGLGAVVEW